MSAPDRACPDYPNECVHPWAHARTYAEVKATQLPERSPADHPHTDPGDGRTECQPCGKWVWPAIHSCKGVPVTERAQARAGRLNETTDTTAAVQAERERIRRNLSLPMLQALRLIPSGRVQQGCIVSDGDVVRGRLRAAYFAITADQPPPLPLDLVEVAPWLEQCGSCDAGLPQSCTCPAGDARVVIARLVDEIVMLRREINQGATA